MVGAAIGSALGVSGPAAGLAVIVLIAINTLGWREAFLPAVVIARPRHAALGQDAMRRVQRVARRATA